MKMQILPQTLAICRLDPAAAVPGWATKGEFFSIHRTVEELSIVCDQGLVPGGTQVERDWRALKVVGTLDFALTGILASIAGPLAKARISLFALSTFDTDYVLVKSANVEAARAALREAGFSFDA